jgi:g-D-glutamyl-meso-diaminopimelate peptidase
MPVILVHPSLKQQMESISEELTIHPYILDLSNQNVHPDELVIPGLFIQEKERLSERIDHIHRLKELMEKSEKIRRTWTDTETIYDSHIIEKELQKIIELFPFVSYRVIGHSVLGKPIYELIIGDANAPKSVHINASFHANEWITTSVVMKWCKELLYSLCTNNKQFAFFPIERFKQTRLSLVPLVNPDGVDLVLHGPEYVNYDVDTLHTINKNQPDFNEWKANIRGVDLNNQFPSFWEIEQQRKPKSPSYRDFPGYAPLTEPEARTMSDLAEANRFDRLLALHTQGEEIYWGYKGFEPEQAQKTVEQFERLSGYKPVRNLDSYAGYRDWFVHRFSKEGYTIELGKGRNPLPFEQFQEIYQKMRGILWTSLFFESD